MRTVNNDVVVISLVIIKIKDDKCNKTTVTTNNDYVTCAERWS